MKAETLIAKLANRFKEPSSWAGFGALLAIVGVNLPAGMAQNIIYIGFVVVFLFFAATLYVYSAALPYMRKLSRWS